MTSAHRDHSHSSTMGSTDLDAAVEAVRRADSVFIGAGAGLSAAAGYDYTDTARFAELFPALKKAGFNARYELIGYPLAPRHLWGYWATHLLDIRFNDEPSPVYRHLLATVGDRPHFVLSSNVDALFTRNGFDGDRVYTPQGDYASYQCLAPCTRQVWDAREMLQLAAATLDDVTGQVAEDAVPSCPNCGGEVFLNVHAGRWYIHDPYAHTGEAMMTWLQQTATAAATTGQRLAVLDLGSGYNTPSVVRWPMEQVTRAIPTATLVRVNRDHPEVPSDLADRSFSIGNDAADVASALAPTGHTG